MQSRDRVPGACRVAPADLSEPFFLLAHPVTFVMHEHGVFFGVALDGFNSVQLRFVFLRHQSIWGRAVQVSTFALLFYKLLELELCALLGVSPFVILGGHLKTGHTWPLQNRPTELSQDKNIYNLLRAILTNIFCSPAGKRFILAAPGRRVWQRGDATRAPIQVQDGGRRKPPPSAAILAKSDKSREREGRALASKESLVPL